MNIRPQQSFESRILSNRHLPRPKDAAALPIATNNHTLITKIQPRHVYQGHDVPYENAIAIGVVMRREKMKTQNRTMTTMPMPRAG